MSRNLAVPMLAAVRAKNMEPFVLLDLTLASGEEHVWSGVGLLTYGGHTYKGVGALGEVGEVSEGSEVRAAGTSVTLNGIDPALLSESMNDIRLGAPATLWLGAFDKDTGTVVSVVRIYTGMVDKPTIPVAPDKISITLAIENRMTNMQRATNRRLTAADQRYDYPDDIGLNWVETQMDAAFIWG